VESLLHARTAIHLETVVAARPSLDEPGGDAVK
jgi:hypothetical protein